MRSDSSGYFDNDEQELNSAIFSDAGKYTVGERLDFSSSALFEFFLCRRGGRLFLLKTLKRDYRDNPVSLAAPKKEFDLGFSLDHHGIIKTFDIATFPETGPGIVLEYCRGENLRSFMDSGRTLDGKELESISAQLVESVKAIHHAGVIHRDIKPSNIIYDSISGNTKIIDFGCADSFDQSLFKGSAGTRFYKHDRFPDTPSEDWYALSLTLSELSGFCTDRAAAKKVLGMCKEMKEGQAPTVNKAPRKFRGIISLGIIAAVAAIAGAFYYLNRAEEPELTKIESPDEMIIIPQVKDSIVADVPDVETSSHVTETDKSSYTEDDGFSGASKNHINPEDDISEVNFCSVNGVYEPLVALVREAAQNVWLEAEQRKFKIYKRLGKVNQSQRDSIDSLVYDEKACCEAILERMGELPEGTDMERAKRLVRKRYLTIFPKYKKSRE